MRVNCKLQVVCLTLITLLATATAGKQSYKTHDKVPLYVNKVGPFNNPSETYQYYNLPFCKPAKGEKYKPESLGEVVDGNRLVSSVYKIPFRTDLEYEKLCTQQLTASDVKKFRRAVANDYYFQIFYDGLPLWGFAF